MREVSVRVITDVVANLCQEANYKLEDELLHSLQKAAELEESNLGKKILGQLLENANIASTEKIPVCQDTGLTVVFLELGQEVILTGGDINEAINDGVAKGYLEGKLRCSIVADPLNRINTKNNTPAIIYTRIVPGDKVKITIAPKGFGSENMGRVKMLKPSDGIEGVKAFILETVELAGANPCPPLVVGVGIGGTLDYAPFLARKALIRTLGVESNKPEMAALEKEMLEKINNLGIGPQGFGGRTTALAVHIETYPTHIAGLPVAVNLSCHALRHATAEI